MNEENTRKYCDMYQYSEDLFELENKMEIYNYYLSNKKSDTFLKLDIDTFFKDMSYFSVKKRRNWIWIRIHNT